MSFGTSFDNRATRSMQARCTRGTYRVRHLLLATAVVACFAGVARYCVESVETYVRLQALEARRLETLGATVLTDEFPLFAIKGIQVKRSERVALAKLRLGTLGSAARIRILDLDGCIVSPESAAALTQFPHLEILSLADSTLTDAHLSGLLTLGQLRYLDVSRTNVTSAMIGRVRRLRPGCSVIWSPWAPIKRSQPPESNNNVPQREARTQRTRS